MASDFHPYKVVELSENYFSFVTSSEVEYICYFTAYDSYFQKFPKIAKFIFAVNLEKRNPRQKDKGADIRIGHTVIFIINSFLEKKINAVVYVCDSSDGKAVSRARKFTSWFENARHYTENIIRLANDFTYYGTTYYTAMLIHNKSKFRHEFASAFLDFMNISDEDK